MNVLYLTTHVHEDDFNSAASSGRRMPNPAGQNFHGKLLKAIAGECETHAICLCPPTLGLQEKDFVSPEGIHYHYVPAVSNKLLRFFCSAKPIMKKAEGLIKPGDVILFDSLNRSLCIAATKLAKAKGVPAVAILTDEISNITGVNGLYIKKIHSLVKKANASYSLTEGLVEAYGLQDKPHLVRPVLVEKVEVVPAKRPRPYVYYGGALFIKDGTKDLIEAYEALNIDYDLVITGHGEYENEVKAAAARNPHIIFLGQVSKMEHYSLIAGSSLAVNPRHYSESLDSLAVPSKVMEYLCFADFIASTLSTPLYKEFKDDANWFKSDIKSATEPHLDHNGKFIKLFENKAKNTIMEEYGISKTGGLLREFLSSLSV